MSCMLWRCDWAPACIMRDVCQDISCTRIQERVCDDCVNRHDCSDYGYFKENRDEKDTSV